MAKRFMLIDPSKPSTSKHPKTGSTTDWGLCVLCQEDTGETLQCPANSTNKETKGVGYKTMTEDLHQFREFDCMPYQIDLSRLDDGPGIESTMMSHHAAWHKTCRARFNKIKLKRAVRRQSSEEGSSSSPNVGERRSGRRVIKSEHQEAVCFFCDLPAGNSILHDAATYDIDSRVRKCARELEDTILLAKLAAGDMIALEAKYHRKCLVNLYNRSRTARSQEDELSLN